MAICFSQVFNIVCSGGLKKHPAYPAVAGGTEPQGAPGGRQWASCEVENEETLN